MQKEKIAAIVLALIIIGALTSYLFITYGDEILDNLTGDGSDEPGIIVLGDCVDVNYIGRLASNDSVFESTYDDIENKSDGVPSNIFISYDFNEQPPEGYEAYSPNLVEGFMEGLVGLTEGETTTIGPIPPEKGFGVIPQIGDVIVIPGQNLGDQDLRIDVVDVKEDVKMPEEYVSFFGDVNTTLYNLRANYSIGDEIPLYPAWESATIVTKVNETMLWTYTTPPEDKRENFTWVDNVTQSEYWEDSSSVTSIDDDTIVVTHSPEIGATMDILDIFGSKTYTVVNLKDDKINVSFIDSTGNTSYTEFDRTVTIQRNVSQVTLMPYPKEGLEQLLAYIKIYLDPDLIYSLDKYAGESLTYEVEIVNVIKTSSKN